MPVNPENNACIKCCFVKRSCPFETNYKHMKKHFILISILIHQVSFSFSQESENGETKPMLTDRPDQTESALTVPRGTFQVETGIIVENNETNSERYTGVTYNTSLIRFGILDNLEFRAGTSVLRLTIESLDTQDENVLQGLTPFGVGTKIAIAEEEKILPAMALITMLTLPQTGDIEFQQPHISPSMILAMSKTISPRYSAGANLGLSWNGEDAFIETFYSLVLGGEIMKRMGAFIELYGFLPEDETGDHRFDAGITYLVLDNLQFDISSGVGINDPAPDYFVSFGLSLRLPG